MIPAGSYWLPDLPSAAAEELASDFGLTLTALDEAPPSDALVSASAPRVAIYRSYQAAMPEGWTRWVLDQYGFEWENVWDADVRSGDLARYDVIVLPSQTAQGIARGHSADNMPVEYTGGLGAEGAAALRSYVEGGGRIVAFDRAVDYAIETFELPFQNRASGRSSQDFFIPGSIIRLEVDPAHPLGWGMAEEAYALFARSQVLERTDGTPTAAVGHVSTPVCFAGSDYLVSGWTLGGDDVLAGRTAVARIEVGDGRVTLFAFAPHFRGQPRNTFKLLFNALVDAASGDVESDGLDCR